MARHERAFFFFLLETNVNKYLQLLGLKVRDRVSNMEGIVTSVSFDLYGCVQCIVDHGHDDKMERKAHWYDHKRLEVLNQTPVMEQPSFDEPGAERGGFDKPLKQ